MSLGEAPTAPTAGNHVPAAMSARTATAGRCPFHGAKPDIFEDWLQNGLQCSAGRREFKLGRYLVTRFRTGAEYAAGFAEFRREVAAERKTGFLALFIHDEAEFRTAADELRALGEAMRQAGQTDDPEALIRGRTLGNAIDVLCPVTGQPTAYEFFSVAFSRHAADRRDPLYDPSLGAPFTAVNTTSDAFAFARLVHDQAIKAWGRAPYEMVHDRDAVELLFKKCVVAWQNMSTTTITNYSRVTQDPARGVYLSDDHQHWVAAHNDPVFAEMEKCPHVHEMPVIYAQRLTEKWSANLFDGQPYVPGRDGQSGGVPLLEGAFEADGFGHELHQL